MKCERLSIADLEAVRRWAEGVCICHGSPRAAPVGFPYDHRTIAEVDADNMAVDRLLDESAFFEI